jgi:RNA polymerase sigma-70 factor (ECF subfamily)
MLAGNYGRPALSSIDNPYHSYLHCASCQGPFALLEPLTMSNPSAHLHVFLAIRRELVGYAAKITGDHIQAEDIVQEAWLRFSPPNAGTRPTVEQPVAYLYRIVRNLALDLKRSRSREHDHTASPPLWLLPTTVNDPAETCQHSMALERLSDALQALPDNSRKALELHRFGGCTLAEIARQLGVSVTTAHRLLREALLALARVVNDQEEEPNDDRDAHRE